MSNPYLILAIIKGEAPDEFEYLSYEDLTVLYCGFLSIDEIQQPKGETLLIFESRISEAFQSKGALIPFRFGTISKSEGDLVDLLKGGYDDFHKLLDYLDGRVELGVRIVLEESAEWNAPIANDNLPPSTGTGREYLKNRLKAHQTKIDREETAAVWEDKVKDALGDVVIDSSHHLSNRVMFGKPTVSVAVLVERTDLDEAQARFEAASIPNAELSGPWPPYSFLGGN